MASLEQIRAHEQLSPSRCVVYLEGRTDPDYLAALVGRPAVRLLDKVVEVDGVVVVGRDGRASVEAHVALGRDHGVQCFGVVDSDGSTLGSAVGVGPGPLWRWPTYSVENLFVVAWPSAWGDVPEFDEVLAGYAPYAAVNRVVRDLGDDLRTLGLVRYRAPTAHPDPVRPPLNVEAEAARLRGASVPSAVELAERLLAEHRAILAGDLSVAVNGKWLIDAYAVGRTGLSKDDVRTTWCDTVRAAGGHPTVTQWWQEHIR